MKILFFDAKRYDEESFDEELKKYDDIAIDYIESDIGIKTVRLASGYDAVCAFVSSDLGKEVLDELKRMGVGLVLMRCAGFNNVDTEYAKQLGIKVLRVPGYSPGGCCGACHGSCFGCQQAYSQGIHQGA